MQSEAEIKKRVDGKVDDVITSKGDIDRILEPFLMDKKKLEKISEYPFKTVLSTCLGLGILPHRADFQKLALYDRGLHQEADSLERDGVIFEVSPDTDVVTLEGVSFDNFNDDLANELKDEVVSAGVTKEAAVSRGLIKLSEPEWSEVKPGEPGYLRKALVGTTSQPPKMTTHKNPVVPLGILASLYYSYSKLMFNDKTTKGFRRFLMKKPWVLPLMVGAGTVGTLKAQEYAFNKMDKNIKKEANYPLAASLSIPLSYYFSAVAEEKARKGIPIGRKENFVRKHPAVVALLTGFGGGKAIKGAKKLKIFKKSKPKKKSWFSRKKSTESTKTANKNFNRNESIEMKVINLVNKLDNKSLDTMYNDLVHN